MPIKFTCPHCKRGITVKEQLAGKKGACPGCKQIVTVPQPTAPQPVQQAVPQTAPPQPAQQATPATQPKPVAKAAPPSQPKPVQPTAPARPKVETLPPPPPPPADVEAEAAALFHDEPPPAEPTEVKTIDLNCPFCDEPIHFTPDLAGKRAPCPECKHILKVPELVKMEPKDWRKAEPRGPSGARLPDQPVPEGAWGSTTVSAVSKQALVEGGAIPVTRAPRTLWQKVRWPVLGVTVVVLLTAGGWTGYRWWGRRAADRALKEALVYAASEQGGKEVGETGRAAISLGAGQYSLLSQQPGCAIEAGKHFGKAYVTLIAAPASRERDALLGDLALAQVELGGSAEEALQELRLTWDKTQQLLVASLSEIQNANARRDAIRAVVQQLITRGQARHVLPLVGKIYATPDGEKAAALSVAGLELWKTNDRPTAEKAADAALELYIKQKPPPLVRAEVVALALILQKKPPKLGESSEDKANEHVGKVEALARQEQWDKARQQASQKDFDEEIQFRALLAIAAAAVDHKVPDTRDLEAAIQMAEGKLRDKAELSWSLLRLTKLAIRGGVADERVLALADRLADRSLRGRAKLAVFRAQLARKKQTFEESAADKIEPTSLARPLAHQALARHNTRLNAGWAPTVQAWQQPAKAFGSLGVALGLQDRDKGS